MMAARDMLPVSEVLFLFFTGRGGSFLSQKEKEKNGGAKRADSVVRPYRLRRREEKENVTENSHFSLLTFLE